MSSKWMNGMQKYLAHQLNGSIIVIKIIQTTAIKFPSSLLFVTALDQLSY